MESSKENTEQENTRPVVKRRRPKRKRKNPQAQVKPQQPSDEKIRKKRPRWLKFKENLRENRTQISGPTTSQAAIRDSNNQIQPSENVNTANKQPEILGPSTSHYCYIIDSNNQPQPPESGNNNQPEPRKKSVNKKLHQIKRGKQRRQRHKEIRKLFRTIKECGLNSNFGLSSFQNQNRLSKRPRFSKKSKTPENQSQFQNKSKTLKKFQKSQKISKGTKQEPEITEEIQKEPEMAEETISRKLQKIIDETKNPEPMEDDCIIIEQKPEIINLDDTAEDLNQTVVMQDNVENEQNDQTTSNSLKRSAFLANLEEGEIEDSPAKKTEKRNLANSYPVIYHEDLTIVVHQNPEKNEKNQPKKRQPAREVIAVLPSTSKEVIAKNSSENDDSVLFVGEEIDLDSFKPQMNFDTMGKAPDFISLSAYGYSPPKKPQNIRNISTKGILKTEIRKIAAEIRKIGCSNVTQLPSSTAVSSIEKKISTDYNSNISNPNRGKLTTGKRMVLVDGSNIAMFKSGGREYSIESIEQCVQHFLKLGHKCKAIVPISREHINTNKKKLQEMFNANQIVYTPSKNLPGMRVTPYDDRFLLQLADEFDAVIISNDNYRDLFNESPSFRKIIQNRVIGFTFADDIFIVPKDPYGRNGPTLDQILNVS